MLATARDEDVVVNPLAICELLFVSPVLRDSDPVVWKMRESPEVCAFLLELASGNRPPAAPEPSLVALARELVELAFLVPAEHDSDAVCALGGTRYRTNPAAPLFAVATVARPGSRPKTRLCLLKYAPAMLALVRPDRPVPVAALETSALRFAKRIGLVVPRADALPADGLFGVPIGPELLELVPEEQLAAIDAWTAHADDLIANPDAVLPQRGCVPPELVPLVPDASWVARNTPDVWVRHPAFPAVYPYWLERDDLDAFVSVRVGTLRPSDIAPRTLRALCAARLLVPAGYHASQAALWRRRLAEAAESLAADQCFRLEGMVEPLALAMYRRYARLMHERKYAWHDTVYDTKERYWISNDPITRMVQSQLAAILREIVPDTAQPAYSLLTMHAPGARLARHKDQQKMCNYAFSLVIDRRPLDVDAWPLYSVADDGRTVDLAMKMGDGALFRPLNVHGRHGELDCWTGLMLFSFVPADYRGYVNGNRIGFN